MFDLFMVKEILATLDYNKLVAFYVRYWPNGDSVEYVFLDDNNYSFFEFGYTYGDHNGRWMFNELNKFIPWYDNLDIGCRYASGYDSSWEYIRISRKQHMFMRSSNLADYFKEHIKYYYLNHMDKMWKSILYDYSSNINNMIHINAKQDSNILVH